MPPRGLRCVVVIVVALMLLVAVVSAAEVAPRLRHHSLAVGDVLAALDRVLDASSSSTASSAELRAALHDEVLRAAETEWERVHQPGAVVQFLSSFRAKLTFLNVIYGAGGLLILLASVLFVVTGYAVFGEAWLTLCCVAWYAMLFAGASVLWRWGEGYELLAKWLHVAALCFVPWATVSCMRTMGNLHFRLYGSQEGAVVVLVFIGFAGATIFFFPIPLLTLPLALATLILSQTLAELLQGPYSTEAARGKIMAFVGIDILLAAYYLQFYATHLAPLGDFSYWLWISGSIAFLTGISIQPHTDSELPKAAYLMLTSMLLFIGMHANRFAPLLLGCLGVCFYLGTYRPSAGNLVRMVALGTVAALLFMCSWGQRHREPQAQYDMLFSWIGYLLGTAALGGGLLKIAAEYFTCNELVWAVVMLLPCLFLFFVAPELTPPHPSWLPYYVPTNFLALGAVAGVLVYASALYIKPERAFIARFFRVVLGYALIVVASFRVRVTEADYALGSFDVLLRDSNRLALVLDESPFPSSRHLLLIISALIFVFVLQDDYFLVVYRGNTSVPPVLVALVFHCVRIGRDQHAWFLHYGAIMALWAMFFHMWACVAREAFFLWGAFAILWSVVCDSTSMLVLGGTGVAMYLAYLSRRVFRNSLLFPLALIGVGFGILYAGLQLQRHAEQIKHLVFALPFTTPAMTLEAWLVRALNTEPLISWLELGLFGLTRRALSAVHVTPTLCIVVALVGAVLSLVLSKVAKYFSAPEIDLYTPPALDVSFMELRPATGTDGHGLVLAVVANKERNFVIKSAWIHMESTELWSKLESRLGSFVIGVFRSTFYPLSLQKSLDIKAFRLGDTDVRFEIPIGTGIGGSQRVLQSTIASNVASFGSMPVTLVITYSSARQQGVLLRERFNLKQLVTSKSNELCAVTLVSPDMPPAAPAVPPVRRKNKSAKSN